MGVETATIKCQDASFLDRGPVVSLNLMRDTELARGSRSETPISRYPAVATRTWHLIFPSLERRYPTRNRFPGTDTGSAGDAQSATRRLRLWLRLCTRTWHLFQGRPPRTHGQRGAARESRFF